MGKLACYILLSQLVLMSTLSVSGELLMVQTLTRHGERAPDKIVSQQSCRTIFKSKNDILSKFEAAPGRLTPLGIRRMREVGSFVRERYVEGMHWKGEEKKSMKSFISTDYQTHQDEWEFIARAGYRQQRSMAAIVEGIFPFTPVPITVDPRTEDPVLGGPAPACGSRTAKMIVDWHKDKGWKMLKEHMDVVEAFETICDVNLTGNPVNAKPGGPNPHAWLGDISDSLDSAFACGVPLPDEITPQLHQKLTKLAFDIQEGSHYDDPQGAIMFAGEFPEQLLSMFERFNDIPEGKNRPKKTPKARLFSCSRELMYGLEKLFGWKTELKGQPKGRVTSATTFIWELHREEDIFDPSKSGLVVRTYYWQPELTEPVLLQHDVALSTYRKRYEDYLSKHGGSWKTICDYEHFVPQHNHHDPDYINPATTVGHEQAHTPKTDHENDQIATTVNVADAPQGSEGVSMAVFAFPVLLVALVGVVPLAYRRRYGYDPIL